MTRRSSIDPDRDPYRLLADVYDSITTKTDDSRFLVGAASTAGGPIIDLACGTARLGLALAHAGFEVMGIDKSEPMLTTARQRLAGEPAEIRRRLQLIRADILAYPFGEACYGMAIIGFSSIFHVPLSADRLRLYARCRRSLRGGGDLVIDNSFYPKPLVS
jgi:SAM-dependent methyltransferase